MAIGLTLKTAGGSTTDGTSFTSASVTPAANTTYLLGVSYSSGTGNPPVPPSGISAWGLNFTQLTTLFYKNLSTNRVGTALYIARTGASPSAGVITFTFAATATGCRWNLLEVTGVITTGTNGSGAVGQTVKTVENAATNNGVNVSVTMAAAAGSGSRTFIVLGSNIATTGNTPLSGWTEFDESFHASPSEAIASYWHPTAFQTNAAVLNSTGAVETVGLIAVELLEAPAGSNVSLDATLAVTATFGAVAVRAVSGGADLAVTSTVTAGIVPTYPVGTSLGVTASINAGAGLALAGGATLAITATLTAGAVRAPMLARVTVYVITATVTADATVAGITTIGLTLAITASLTTTASITRPLDASLPVTAILSATLDRSVPVVAVLPINATVTADAAVASSVTANLPIVATIGAGAVRAPMLARVTTYVITATISADVATAAPILIDAALPVTVSLSAGAAAVPPVLAGANLAVTAGLSASMAYTPLLIRASLVITASVSAGVGGSLILPVGTPVSESAMGADVLLTFSVAPVEGDVTVLIGGHYSRGEAGPVTPGYTVGHYRNDGNPYFGMWFKRQGSSPDLTVTGLGSGNALDAAAYVAYVLRGVDPAIPLDFTAVGVVGLDPASVTVNTAGTLVIVGTGLSQDLDVTPGTIPGYGNTVVEAG